VHSTVHLAAAIPRLVRSGCYGERMNIEGAVPRIESPSPETFRDAFAQTHKPVVITGATKGWKAHSKWTREYLETTIGPKTVRVKESSSHIHPDLFSSSPAPFQTMKFTDYVSLIWSNDPARNRKYLSGDEIRIISNYIENDPALSSLIEDFQFPNYFDRQRLNTCGFWLSAAGVLAALHYDADGSHNLNVQVRGKKRVLLFSPKEFLYPFPGTQLPAARSNFSQVNIENPDLKKFPRFKSARCEEAVLEEGDMLFIPSFWSHAVYHIGEVNININFWWQPDEYCLSKTSLRSSFLDLFVRTITNGKRFPKKEEIETAMRALSPQTLYFVQSMENGIGDLHNI
jgi:oxalate decarboxylase/phosphoglucose isomerase-like protein (cupin superfamily)